MILPAFFSWSWFIFGTEEEDDKDDEYDEDGENGEYDEDGVQEDDQDEVKTMNALWFLLAIWWF